MTGSEKMSDTAITPEPVAPVATSGCGDRPLSPPVGLSNGRVSLVAEFREMVHELIHYRELLWQMVLRDIRIRYKQAVMGFGWAILMPAMVVAAGCLVKYAMAQAANDTVGVPRLAGMSVKALGWAFFTGAIGFAANSLVSNITLVTKVYFPREMFPLAAVLTQAFDTLIGCLVLAGLLVVAGGIGWTWSLLWVPLLILELFLFTAGLSLVLSCANVFFRDVKYIVQVLLTFGIFFTPVFYEPQFFGPMGAHWMMLNPLAPMLEGLRLTIVEQHNLLLPLVISPPDGTAIIAWQPWYLGYAAAWSVFGFLGPWLLFHKLEFIYAEYI
jgi:ABC-type polysaccharide/polyol phosphate export permease